jgi:hypothetical protein
MGFTAQISPDGTSIIFGVFLNGRGQIELRNPAREPHLLAINYVNVFTIDRVTYYNGFHE